MSQSISEFLCEQERTLQRFGMWWIERARRDPDNYPLVMADDNEGLWWEMLQDFAEKDAKHAWSSFRGLAGDNESMEP